MLFRVRTAMIVVQITMCMLTRGVVWIIVGDRHLKAGLKLMWMRPGDIC